MILPFDPTPMDYSRLASSTAYCQSGTTASGRQTRWGYVAENTLRLGTRIVVSRPVNGRRHFRVMDRIGAYSQLDFFMWSCSAARQFGRRKVRFRTA